jgi:type I restriction enzyme M protein
MKFITEAVKRRFTTQLNTARNIQAFIQNNFYPDDYENKWADRYIYGSEIDPDLGTSVKVNMVLHGDGSANIFVGSEKGDGLASFSKYTKFAGVNILNSTENPDSSYPKETNQKFDIIITNPPFSVTLDKDTARDLKNLFVFGDKKNSENLFVERWYQLLKPDGRFGVVLPESVFDTTENKYIRLFIYKYFKVKAVVSLPQLTFEPFTSTKTSLLFAQKKTKAEIEEWNKLWNKYSNEWSVLRTRCENLLAVYFEGKDRKKLPSVKGLKEIEEKQILARMLKDYLEKDDKKLSAKASVEKFQDELKELCKYDNDTKDAFGFVNTWWVFGEVAKELNYKIFMAEVENVGYKRTKRGEKPMPNELYRINGKGEVLVDDLPAEFLAKEGGKLTALDYMRKIEWE